MNIAKTTENGVCTVSPSGRIDSASAQEFSTVMEEALKESRNIIVDMKEAEYITVLRSEEHTSELQSRE